MSNLDKVHCLVGMHLVVGAPNTVTQRAVLGGITVLIKAIKGTDGGFENFEKMLGAANYACLLLLFLFIPSYLCIAPDASYSSSLCIAPDASYSLPLNCP